MPITGWWSIGRAALFGLVVAATTTAVMPMLPLDRQVTVEASVAFDKEDKDKDKEKEKQEKDQNEDRIINGQVLEIDTLKDPPELVLGSVDGQTVVRVLKTDEIALNAIHLGDYIEANGEKIHEQLFEATLLSVSSRYADDVTENDNEE